MFAGRELRKRFPVWQGVGMPEEKALISDVPDETQAPSMYVHGTWILGGIVALCLAVLAVLIFVSTRGLPVEIVSAIVTAVVALGSPAVAGLASIYIRKQ